MGLKYKLNNWLNKILDIIVVICISVLGMYNQNYEGVDIKKYSLILLCLFISGILYYKINGVKELDNELIKSTIIAIALPVVITAVGMRNNTETLKESVISLTHAGLLRYIIKELDEDLCSLPKVSKYLATVISIVLILILVMKQVNILIAGIFGITITKMFIRTFIVYIKDIF